ncbi:hypothetical protein H8356DRAFT_1364186 [Neocallimastix lanati (nom. inval.)]|nr:hypothetical protein H8356DRAFT_1364186 [Neocallimastix sp. JGI-2020a]
MGHICPEYNSIKSLSNKKKENFMIFKNHDLIAFQSPFQDKTFLYCTYNLVDNKYSSIEIFHCDFEKAISNAAEKVFLINCKKNLNINTDYEKRTSGEFKALVKYYKS